MKWTTILIIVGAAIVLIFILLFVLFGIKSKKKAQSLKNKIDKIKAEAKSTEEVPPVLIVDDEKEEQEKKEQEEKQKEEKDRKPEPIIEDISTDELFDMPKSKRNFKVSSLWDDDDLPREIHRKPSRRVVEDDEFEDFLNEHSYTRKVLDQDMINKLNSLPPEVRAMILGNIFNKFDN